MTLNDYISTNTVANGGALTAESFRAGWDRLKEMSDQADREYGERAREVAARGRYQSRLGQIIDSAYIRSGPMIMSPTRHAWLTAELAAEEARAAAGVEQHLSEDGAIRLSLAAWVSPYEAAYEVAGE